MVATVAVLSDVHGVLPALDRVLQEPEVVSADLTVVTGDHIWGPQPAETLDRLTALGERAVLVRGNADRELLQMSRGEDIGLGEDPLSVWGATQLSPHHQTLLANMPEHVTLDIEGFGPVLFCHATPRNDEEVVLVDTRLDRWTEVLHDVPDEVDTIVCGHTHMPYLRIADGRLIVNPGSVGLPYGRPGAHWTLLANGAVTMRRTLIDPDELIAAVTAGSSMPGIAEWAEENLRHPASDAEALAAFGPRDGRDAHL
ncbi:putative phosphoesterase [Branchiibius hedensis]|uniref:Phosphoesterase n=1 Tax=Branchiibius hedensis TaxID=672460 RepID=A0A2Y9C0U7_9MICO|nr:metallophosphoesterase family protein [Branchiibius hedensis]PWJ24336.1 putative phosphoesterase [Branchiibius hedensis]SSA33153.1 phosphoesterase, MJ0936 family [Branchiibius hedensis]